MDDNGAAADGSGRADRHTWPLADGPAADPDHTPRRQRQPVNGEWENPYGAGESPYGAGESPYGAGGREAPAASDLSGRLVGGRYRLIERLGQGGMGTVWRAHDEVIARDVAVKEPRLPSHIPSEERDLMFTRLEREARAAARIEHPSVVGIHDVVPVSGRPWVVMELVRGQSLADVLAEGTLPPEEAARIALPLVGVLAAAHTQNVLHRDVKPSNVMLGPSGRIVLTDFGIAHIEGETPLTQTGAVVGSPEYIAPERVNGQLPGPASDFFSLGVLLYTAIEGFSPFRRQQTQSTFQAVLNAEPQEPLHAGVLADLVMQLLSKAPQDRPTSGEITSTLERVASPRPTLNPAGSPAGPQNQDGGGTTGGGPDNGRGQGRTGGGEADRAAQAEGPPGKSRHRKAAQRGGSRGGVLTHPAVTALVASLVTGAVVSAVLWPQDDTENSASDTPGDASGKTPGDSPSDAPNDKRQSPPASSEVPKGWKTQRKIGASIAVPADYTAEKTSSDGSDTKSDSGSESDDFVAFRDEKGQVNKQLLVMREPALTDPKGPPEERALFWYNKYTSSGDVSDQQVTLGDTEVNGRKSKMLTWTFTSDDGQLWRKKELFYDHGGEMWKLVVDWEVDGVEDGGGDQFFEKVLKTFEPAGGRSGDGQRNS